MGEVFLDGEAVDFQGNPPENMSEVWQLIEGHLASSLYSIKRYRLDGDSWSNEFIGEVLSWRKVEFESVSIKQGLVELIEEWGLEVSNLSEDISSLSGVLLCLRWEDAQRATVELFDKLSPVIEGVGLITSYGKQVQATWLDSLSEANNQVAEVIDLAINFIRTRDCVGLSDTLANGLSSRWESMSNLLFRETLEDLRKGGAS